MRVSIAAKIAIFVSFLAIIMSGMVGVLVFEAGRDNMLRGTEERLKFETALMETHLQKLITDTHDDLQLTSTMREIKDYAHASLYYTPTIQEETAAAVALHTVIESHPYIYQIRIISREGMELLRLERTPEHVVKHIASTALQNKAHRDYVKEGLKLKPGEFYFSPVDLNMEYEKVDPRLIPTIRTITPIMVDQQPGPLIVMNLDLSETIGDTINRLKERQWDVSISDPRGVYLLHKDRELIHAMGPEDLVKLTDHFPWAQEIISGYRQSLFRLQEDPGTGEDFYTFVFGVRLKPEVATGHKPLDEKTRPLEPANKLVPPHLIVTITTPEEQLAAPARTIRNRIWVMSFSLGTAGVFLILLAVSWVMHPLTTITLALNRLRAGERDVALPTELRDEIGTLAVSFQHMADRIETQMGEIQERESRLSAIVENSADAILTTDHKGNILTINPAFTELFGFEPREVLKKNVSLLMGAADRQHHDAFISHYLRSGNSVIVGRGREVMAYHKDGTAIPVHIALSRFEIGKDVYFTGVLHNLTTQKQNEEALSATKADLERRVTERTAALENLNRDLKLEISARKEAQQALSMEKERIQVTLASIGEGVIATDADGRVTYLNPIAELLTGWHMEEAERQPIDNVYNLIDEESGHPIPNLLQRLTMADRGSFPKNLQMRNRMGSQIAVEQSGSVIQDASGKNIGAVVVFRDVTTTRALARELSHQASHDALTGLVNRREFEQRLDEAIRRAHVDNQYHCLCYMDLDQFKVVNDSCGHRAGDELLQQLGYLLRDTLRKGDTLARLGGDEFGLLMENCAVKNGQEAMEKIISLISNFRFGWEGKTYRLGVSIGIVQVDRYTNDGVTAMASADAACYAAKQGGRNRVHVYRPEDEDISSHRTEVAWVNEVQEALQQDRLCLHAQLLEPNALSGPEGLHYECLVRMKMPDGSLAMPGAFIAAAERFNQMNQVDRWIVTHALKTLKNQPGLLENTRLCSINLSGRTVGDDTFASFVTTQMHQFGIPAHKLCFELTETAAVQNMTKAVSFINYFRDLGACFALDDFGSGMSSFVYLKSLPVDIVKIDGGLVREIDHDIISFEMVEAINNIGHAMGMRTVAEFCENEAIKNKLQLMGVDYMQGYAIARPKPIEELS